MLIPKLGLKKWYFMVSNPKKALDF